MEYTENRRKVQEKQKRENEQQWIWWMADAGSMQGKGRNEGTGIWTVTH